MNPHISLPRHNAGPSSFGGTPPSARNKGVQMPQFFKRLFKFPQMDFEMAIWEMTSLIIAPKKVFRSIYYHKRSYFTFAALLIPSRAHTDGSSQRQRTPGTGLIP